MNRELSFSWKSRWSADLTAGITEAHLTRSHQLHCCGHAMHGSLFSLHNLRWLGKRWTSQPWEFKGLVHSRADGLGSCRRCGLDGGSVWLGVGFEVSKPLAIYSQVACHYACCHFPVRLMDSNPLEQKAQTHISFYKLPRLWCCTIAMKNWRIHTQNLIFIFLFPSFLRPSLLLPRLALTLLCSWVWPWTSELPMPPF